MPKQRSTTDGHSKKRFVSYTVLDGRTKYVEVKDGMSVKDIHRHYSAMGKAAMWHKKANGETMHLAPLGYRNIKKDGRSTIEPNPKVYPLVQEAKERQRNGWSIRKICKHMEKRGLCSQRGNVIKPGAMQRVLRTSIVSNADSLLSLPHLQ